jgi:hypothetical protein
MSAPEMTTANTSDSAASCHIWVRRRGTVPLRLGARKSECPYAGYPVIYLLSVNFSFPPPKSDRDCALAFLYLMPYCVAIGPWVFSVLTPLLGNQSLGRELSQASRALILPDRSRSRLHLDLKFDMYSMTVTVKRPSQ